VPSGRLRRPSVIKVTDSQSEEAALAGIPLAIYGFSSQQVRLTRPPLLFGSSIAAKHARARLKDEGAA
jgi:hypothetical protein